MFKGLVARGVLRSGMGCRVRPNLAGRAIGPCPAGQQFHLGMDVQAREGTPVRAAWDGVVKRVFPSGALTGYGNVVVIQHPNSLMTLYAHLRDYAVTPGQVVRQGDDIARVGQTGVENSGPHLHFEALVGDSLSSLHGFTVAGAPVTTPNPSRVDPESFLAAVLMPLQDWSSL